MKTNTKLIALMVLVGAAITTAALTFTDLAGYSHTVIAYTNNLTSVASPTITPNRAMQATTIKQTNNSNARHSHEYEGIKYDTDLGMLVFKDVNTFNNTMTSLANDIKNFQYDNGKTEHLLALLTKKNNDSDDGGDDEGDGDLLDKLSDNSPLSDTVMVTFLKGNHTQQTIKKIIELNIDFSESVAAVYNSITLDSAIRKEIDGKRFNHVPYDYVLDTFEKQFQGYTSYRDDITQQEATFLRAGGDPENPANPGNSNNLSDVMGTLFNAKQEVKIGISFIVLLPNREVQILNNKVDILNYIRQNGNIPFNPPLANEPINGFLKSVAPPPVDTNIIVTPTGPVDQENGCGGGGSIDPIINPVNGRYSFSLPVKGTVPYYWDFGDGYVSYQANPSHAYKANSGLYHITGTIYDSYGSPCGGGGNVGTGTTTPSGAGNGNNVVTGCTAFGNVGYTVDYNTNTVTFNASPPAGNNFTSGQFSWDFGDGFSINGVGYDPVHHYPYTAGTYPVTVVASNPYGCWKDIIQLNLLAVTKSNPPITCCDKRDKEVHNWVYCDHKHKFRHVLKAKHLSFSNITNHPSEVFAKVTQFHRVLGTWTWNRTTCSVALYGIVYGLDGNGVTCGGARWDSVNVGQSGAHARNALHYYPNSNVINELYISHNGVRSIGIGFINTTYPTPDTIYVTDCFDH